MIDIALGRSGSHMEIFLQYGYPQIIHFNRICHCKPTILGYPHLWKTPYWMATCSSRPLSRRTTLLVGSLGHRLMVTMNDEERWIWASKNCWVKAILNICICYLYIYILYLIIFIYIIYIWVRVKIQGMDQGPGPTHDPYPPIHTLIHTPWYCMIHTLDPYPWSIPLIRTVFSLKKDSCWP